MARRRTAIAPITDPRSRSVTFVKRRHHLIKKAHELSVLCSCDVALVLFFNGRCLQFTNRGSFRDVWERCREWGDESGLHTGYEEGGEVGKRKRRRVERMIYKGEEAGMDEGGGEGLEERVEVGTAGGRLGTSRDALGGNDRGVVVLTGEHEEKGDLMSETVHKLDQIGSSVVWQELIREQPQVPTCASSQDLTLSPLPSSSSRPHHHDPTKKPVIRPRYHQPGNHRASSHNNRRSLQPGPLQLPSTSSPPHLLVSGPTVGQPTTPQSLPPTPTSMVYHHNGGHASHSKCISEASPSTSTSTTPARVEAVDQGVTVVQGCHRPHHHEQQQMSDMTLTVPGMRFGNSVSPGPLSGLSDISNHRPHHQQHQRSLSPSPATTTTRDPAYPIPYGALTTTTTSTATATPGTLDVTHHQHHLCHPAQDAFPLIEDDDHHYPPPLPHDHHHHDVPLHEGYLLTPTPFYDHTSGHQPQQQQQQHQDLPAALPPHVHHTSPLFATPQPPHHSRDQLSTLPLPMIDDNKHYPNPPPPHHHPGYPASTIANTSTTIGGSTHSLADLSIDADLLSPSQHVHHHHQHDNYQHVDPVFYQHLLEN